MEEASNKKIFNKEYVVENEKFVKIDNFFKTPLEINAHMHKDKLFSQCLSLDEVMNLDDGVNVPQHSNFLKSLYPGVTTALNPENEDDLLLYNVIGKKIEEHYKRELNSLNIFYNITPGRSMHGCVHVDNVDSDANPNMFSGVIYMSPNFPINCGTKIYNYANLNDLLNSFDLTVDEYLDLVHIIYDTNISPNNFVKKKCFEEVSRIMGTLKVYKTYSYEFNTFIAFPSYVLHSAEYYFGEHMTDSRHAFKVFFEFKN